mgnify:CR=1 FL=1
MASKTQKIAVVGNRDAILPFQMIGFQTFPVAEAQETINTLRHLSQEDFGIIYLTEQLAKDLPDVLDRYKDELRPAIILIPGREGSLGIGMNNIQQSIQRAVGADIL